MCNKEACMWKNKENKTKLGDNGFTLVEVLASFAILLLVSQMLLFGIRFSMKMRERAELLETERRMIGTHVMNRENCIPGTLRLEFGSGVEELEREGWLYCGPEITENDRMFSILWVDEDE